MGNTLDSLYDRIKKGLIDRETGIGLLKELGAARSRNGRTRPGNDGSGRAKRGKATNRDVLKTEAALIAAASAVLGVEPRDIDTGAELDELGMDEVRACELSERMRNDHAMVISPEAILSHRTLGEAAIGLANGNDLSPEANVDEHAKVDDPGVMIDGTSDSPVGEDLVREKAVQLLKNLISSVIKLPAQKIDADAQMDKYGIDSIMVVKLNDRLESSFGVLPKTLFFEYRSIRELARYFVESHGDKITGLTGLDTGKKAEQARKTEQEKPRNTGKAAERFAGRLAFHRDATKKEREQGAFDVAIIGLSGRYPKAKNVEEFWENVRDGKDCITEIPSDRWDHSAYYDPDKTRPGKTYGKWGGFLDRVDLFDTLFFNISPRDAEIMDPQERLFLETAWEAVEDAGYTRDTLASRAIGGIERNVGVYVGVMYEEYQLYGAQEQLLGNPITLSANPASVANRVSHHLDFHGPSLALDTMCSSSLTAIHLACESLRGGSCEVAIAGGVNVSVHPNKYLMLGLGRFVSSKGQCESFGVGGDGYVPGEGVGAIVLKPLSHAIEDGDHVYGIIKGTAVNHGGKTNGYAVPNPNAQAAVISRAMKAADVDPRSVSYIEAHGTGTSLGDPIEIAGLTKAFREKTRDAGFCAIGSAKSNIGHCESAAGIAGVTKVLMQLKYRKLAPSLHSRVLNPNIDFVSSPFVVQQELADWNRPFVNLDGTQTEVPRIAGVSSFGAGGSNAHVIIEEFDADPVSPVFGTAAINRALILLSARNPDRLAERARTLREHVMRSGYAETDLPDIAYTLQVGREAMDERACFACSTIGELERGLSGIAEGRENDGSLYRGRVKSSVDSLAVFGGDDDMESAVGSWLAKGKLEKVAELWVKGLDIDWRKHHGGARRRRMSLPFYPFSGERYWAPKRRGEPVSQGCTRSGILHPLLHENVSDLGTQCYASDFDGSEFFFRDHSVHGSRLLPGVAQLEMAGEAVRRCVPGHEGTAPVRLTNVVWLRPVEAARDRVRTEIVVSESESGLLSYEISVAGTNPEEAAACSRGNAELSETCDAPLIDIQAILSSCDRGVTESDACYGILGSAGLSYGPSFRCIERIFAGTDRVLAKLTLNGEARGTRDGFFLHPGMTDSAIQSSLGLLAHDSSSEPSVPFALDELVAYDSTCDSMWAYVRYAEGSSGTVKRLDIDMADDTGRVRVSMKGLSLRRIEAAGKKGNAAKGRRTLLLEHAWKEKSIDAAAPMVEYAERVVLGCGAFDGIGTDGARYESIDSKAVATDRRYRDIACSAFGEIRGMLRAKHKAGVLVQILVPLSEGDSVLFGLSGLLRCARLENPKLAGQVIGIDPSEGDAAVRRILSDNSRHPTDTVVRYANGKRTVSAYAESRDSAGKAGQPWKSGGVYLVTGGAGGLGLLFAREIAERAERAVVVLAGRSELGDDKAKKLAEINANGARVVYERADVSVSAETESLVSSISESFGRLDGVIHAAGIIRDNYIIKKTTEEYDAVLAPKVSGTVNLDHATRDMGLDFFVCFSSLSGALGNPGQADYAAANAFMDAFVRTRNALVRRGKRSGRSVSINWPLWTDGGMHTDPETGKLVERNTGMVPLSTQAGIEAFYRSIGSDKDSIIVCEGDAERMKRFFRENAAAVVDIPGESEPVARESLHNQTSSPEPRSVDLSRTGAAGQVDLSWKTNELLKKELSSVIKLPPEKIEADMQMEKYGIDSVMSMQLVDRLEKLFGALSKTLVFEYGSISALSAYLMESHKEKLAGILGLSEQPTVRTEVTQPGETPVIEPPATRKPKATRRAFRFGGSSGSPETRANTTDIAVIGISFRLPGAKNTEELYANLMAGKDCITEVPPGRWDHDKYFDPEKGKPGKTYCKWGGFIDEVDAFDPLFFGISPLEANVMDPQERLFLETAWNLFEGAGITRAVLGKKYGGKVGVFVGSMYQMYHQFSSDSDLYPAASLSSYSAIANRVSYFFNLSGPSIAVDTACSSSTYAIHLACENIRSGESLLAVAGGVNLALHPRKYLGLSIGALLGSHPGSRSFANGDGFLPAEGVGAVLLKPLDAAIRDSDDILCVIKSTATNHGGHTNGYTVPNPNAQGELIEGNFRKSGINPRTIGYVEAAANGSLLGDAIEVSALTKAFRKFTQDAGFCAIGSVKSNIGHAEAVSGISQLARVIVQLRKKTIAPAIFADNLNPNMEITGSPFVIHKTPVEWKRHTEARNGIITELPLRATVSSFGAGGSNTHMIIEEYVRKSSPVETRITPSDQPEQDKRIIILSARNSDSLRAAAKNLLEFAKGNGEMRIGDLAFTLATCREEMEQRLALVVRDREELVTGLADYISAAGGHGSGSAIPILAGDTEATRATLKNLLSGVAAETIAEALMRENNPEKIAGYWAIGGAIPWDAFYGEEAGLKRIALPGYPFQKRRCWIDAATRSGVEEIPEENREREIGDNDSAITDVSSIARKSVCEALGLRESEIDEDRELAAFGMDSLLTMALVRLLQSRIDPAISPKDVVDCRTTRELADRLKTGYCAKGSNERKGSDTVLRSAQGKRTYPELVRLNSAREGKPVFWFHAAMGGVEIYQAVADKSERPFYGIQARGWMSDDEPMRSLSEMAAYYAEVIDSADPDGPYDLGGYSMGGAIAYEVTRLMQERGRRASSIVMLDSVYAYMPDDAGGEESADMLWKDAVLRIINMMLIARNRRESRGLTDGLVHRSELDIGADRKTFLGSAVSIAIRNGIGRTESGLARLLEQNARVQVSYGATNYKALPLHDPSGVTCYYFRNKGRSFYGSLEPYMKLETYSGDLDGFEYWKEWEKNIRDFRITDIDTESHMMLLEDMSKKGAILDFCEGLYSRGPSSSSTSVMRPGSSNREIGNVSVLAFGSMGDVQPFIALAKGLMREGCEVTLVGIDEYEDPVTRYGVRFKRLGVSVSDLKRIFLDRHGAEISAPFAASADGKENLSAQIAGWLEKSYEACRGCGLLLYTGLAYHYGVHLAEAIHAPAIPVYLQPILENSESPSFMLEDPGPGRELAIRSYELAEKSIWLHTGKPINEWRTKHGLVAVTPDEAYAMKHRGTDPAIYGFSPLVFAKPAEWNESVFVPGFFFLEENGAWKPSGRLENFLDSGSPPVYVGFGSMNAYVDRPTLELIVRAIRDAGERVLLFASPEKALDANAAVAQATDAFVCGYTPHHWLFPRTKAVIHHGGAGTTAAAIKAGVPSIVVPFISDQFFWGDRAHRLGVAPAPIRFRDLTASNLGYALKAALGDPLMRERTAALGRGIGKEDGTAKAAARIKELAAEWKNRQR